MFDVKDMGKLTYFWDFKLLIGKMGIFFLISKNVIDLLNKVGIVHCRLCYDFLNKAGMVPCRPCSTPGKPHT